MSDGSNRIKEKLYYISLYLKRLILRKRFTILLKALT